MTTKPMPLSTGMVSKKVRIASKPPAEAPIAAMHGPWTGAFASSAALAALPGAAATGGLPAELRIAALRGFFAAALLAGTAALGIVRLWQVGRGFRSMPATAACTPRRTRAADC